MKQLAWDDSRSSSEVSPVPPQHPSPRCSSQAQVAPVPPKHGAKPGCEHTQGESPSFPRERQIAKLLLFALLLAPL